MNSIALIVPYFGNLNKSGYFGLFLKSCKNNPTVDFLIYTDDKTDYGYPKNVKVCYTTLEQIKGRIQSLYDFPVSLSCAYKLCDYKAAYGEIFAEDLKDYDFWGHTDSDLIFGDIRSFVTEEKLESYDKLYTRGHLTLYRNTPENNSRYRCAIQNGYNTDYRRVFSSESNFSFDEWGREGGINRIFMKANVPIYDQLDFDDIKVESLPFYPVQRSKNAPHSSLRNTYYVYDGKDLIRVSQFFDEIYREKVLYAHFQKRSMKNNAGDADRFIIVPNSFEPYRILSEQEQTALPKDKSKAVKFALRMNNAIKRRMPKRKGR